jgi:hypothetical protein
MRLVLSIALGLAISGAGIGCRTNDATEVPLYPVPFKAADGRLFVFDGSDFAPTRG